ncbi:CDP-alcohol phosphatidyltransferase family protein [Alphaproteobacteria bacterium]|nr:CDP-alcohol phosphatidyltransferase family protein [Alphaproteobacteria bacterium]MDC0131921.1 CDP-alcohol phosphatidyltransferase family protein [Alphaproteobacteria bacterium]
MLDPVMRRLIDPPLNQAAQCWPSSVSANQITIIGFGVGLASCLAVTQQAFGLALLLLLINRFGDGLDGAVARRDGPTDLGSYLDIVADFLLWSLLPLAFLVNAPQNATAAAVLLSSFAMSMVVFLAFAILAEKRGVTTAAQGKKSFFYMAGLAEGTETIAFFVFVMWMPEYFRVAAYAFAALVYVSVLGRIFSSYQTLKDAPNE